MELTTDGESGKRNLGEDPHESREDDPCHGNFPGKERRSRSPSAFPLSYGRLRPNTPGEALFRPARPAIERDEATDASRSPEAILSKIASIFLPVRNDIATVSSML